MPKRKTKEEFIEDAIKLHGNEYDYSNVEYVNNRTLVRIICNKHGEFLQTPDVHLRGCGCPICRWKKAQESIRRVQGLTTEEFIRRAKEVHGDKYDYSKVKYENTDTKVCIICPEHGEFWQTPHHHLNGHGCPVCGRNDISEEKITNVFKKHFNVISQYRPDFLKENGKSQSIDIFLPEYNIGIEYQGRQHFRPISRFGGEIEFKNTIERDKRKFEKCKDNGIEIMYFTYEKENEIPQMYFNKIFTNENEIITEIKHKRYDNRL